MYAVHPVKLLEYGNSFNSFTRSLFATISKSMYSANLKAIESL